MKTRLEELARYKAAGEHLAAIRLAEALLAAPERLTRLESVLIARAGFTAGSAMEQFHLAAAFTVIEERCAQETLDSDLIAVAAFHRGTALLYLGDTHLSQERLLQFVALDMPHRHGLNSYRGPALFNLGIAYMLGKEYQQAVRSFMSGQAVFEAACDYRGAIRCNLEAAWAELLDDSPEPAGRYLDRAITLLAEYPEQDLQAVCLCHRAYYHHCLGDISTAARLCEEVMTPGRSGVTSHQLSEAAWIAGECALATGHMEAARMLSALALDEAITAKWPALMNRAGDLARRVNKAGTKPA